MSQIVFQWPLVLVLLLGLIPLQRMLHHARRQREEMVTQFGGKVDEFRKTKDRFRLLAIVLLLLALTRPGVDPQRLSVANVGRDVVFVLDVSQSMLAEDILPSRLEVAKQGVRDALKSFQSARVGLVIYAGSANILCPLTHDHDFVRYMLEQATPRSVDFGGTQLIAAVEKTVDQVFSAGRAGFQDLVLLTDGEDHTGDYQKIADWLKTIDAGLLIIGIGDAERGARIPQTLEDGKLDWLRYDGEPVETKLNRESLRQLERTYRDSQYVETGTAPFDLGALYLQFAQERPSGGSDLVGDTIVVYREIGFFFLFFGLVLFLLLEMSWMQRIAKRKVVLIFMFSVLSGMGTMAQEQPGNRILTGSTFKEQAEELLAWQQAGKFEQVLTGFDEICAMHSDIEERELAVLYFNQGLCHLQVAKQQEAVSPRVALAETQAAQYTFLLAKQLSPDFARAGQRLDAVNALIHDYRQKIKMEEEQQDEIQKRIQVLLEKLQLLSTAQNSLKDEIPQYIRKKKVGGGEVSNPIGTVDSFSWQERQQELIVTGKEMGSELAALDEEMTLDVPGLPPVVSAFAEPSKLMYQAVAVQETGAGYLKVKGDWPLARRDLGAAVRLMNEILQMLADQSSSDSQEEQEEGEMDEDWEMYEEGMFDESQASSMPMAGDMAQTAEMQPLPKPNYSAEEILGEEIENQQFRQQKRTASQAGKVEKDW